MKHRFNLELTPAAKQQIDQLQTRTQAASWSEVMRRALATYDTLEAWKAKGWDIIVRNKAGDEKQVLLV